MDPLVYWVSQFYQFISIFYALWNLVNPYCFLTCSHIALTTKWQNMLGKKITFEIVDVLRVVLDTILSLMEILEKKDHLHLPAEL